MKVLLVGKGSREHALAWKFSQSSQLGKLYLVPGNPAMASLGELIADVGDEPSAIVAKAKELAVDLVVCGPEAPLAVGLADQLQAAGIPCFGPQQAAAELEASKAFAKDVMGAAQVPTAAFVATQGRAATEEAARTMLARSGGTVLKASGLAGGKGVFVCQSEADLEQALNRFETSMPKAFDHMVVEEILQGRECSYFVFLGKQGPQRLGFAVDFKRLEDGDAGPNTGGMGCYSPVPWLPADAGDQVDRLVVEPVARELQARGLDYCGCLYVGLMWGERGPQVVEFNVRLGDPECQVLAAQDDRDWLAMMAAQAGAGDAPASIANTAAPERSSVAVVMASGGYPYGEGQDGKAHVDAAWLQGAGNDRPVFAASVRQEAGSLVTGSGRVFTVTGSGANFAAARDQAYRHVARLRESWPEAKIRSDIGALAAKEEAAR